MSTKMTVVYLEHTGHVLAALRQRDDTAPKLATLVGSAFPLRVTQAKPSAPNTALFDLPAALLKVGSLALDERVIGRPQAFVIDNDRVAELPVAPTVTAALAQGTLTLTLGTAPSVDTKLFAAVRGNEATYREQRLMAGNFQAGSANLVMNLTLTPSGPDAALEAGRSCDLAVALAGYPLIHLTEST